MNLDLLSDNPVFVRELRRRMRGRGLIVFLCLYIAAMCAFAYLIISIKSQDLNLQRSGRYPAYSTFGGPTYTTVSTIGQTLYALIVGIQAALVLMIAPTITAAMVKAEKERETFEFLKVTTITSGMYVVGALLSTLLYVSLGLFCALPVLTIAYLYGGVSDLGATTISLLALSTVLSSGGLLVSCATEKGRKGQAQIGIGLFALGVSLFVFQGIAGRLYSSFSPGQSVTISGYAIPHWLLLGIACVAISVWLLMIARRKLFHPEERAMNGRQCTALFGIGNAAALWWVLRGISGGQNTPGMLSARLAVATGVYTVLGLLVQNTLLLNRVDTGNERWRLKKKRPELRNVNESMMLALVLTLLGGAALFLAHWAVYGSQAVEVYAALPPILFLLFNAGVCVLALKLVADEYTALKIALAVSGFLLIAPPLISQIQAGLVRSYVSELITCFSPLAASAQLRDKPDDAVLAGLGVLALAGLTVIAWMFALSRRDRHGNPHVSYDLEM